MRALLTVVLACTWVAGHGGLCSADDAAEEEYRPPEPKVVFEEDFKSYAGDRFRPLHDSNEAEQNLVAGTASLAPGSGWLRPAGGGFRAELTVGLSFPALTDEADARETELGFVLGNAHLALVRLHRVPNTGQAAGTVEIVDAFDDPSAPQQPTKRVLRHFDLTGDLPEGEWRIAYNHGLVVVSSGGNEIARGYLQAHGVPVVGIVWDQLQGRVTCHGMALSGVVPPARTPAEEARLQEAAQLNQRGMALYRQGALEALTSTKQASDIYAEVLGEWHHDTANSYFNLGMVFQLGGASDEAQDYLERSLKVRRRVLGDDHPEVGTALLSLAQLLLTQNKVAEARANLIETLSILEGALGPDAETTRSLRETLNKLPTP
jgi:hypothetical protein